MNSIDLTRMLGNLSQSLVSVQHLISAIAYVTGALFVLIALLKFRTIADARMHSSSQEKMLVPIAFTIGGMALLYLPTAIKTLIGTAFGPTNILSYASYDPFNVYNSVGILIQTAGVIWFVRGVVLLTTSADPQVKHAGKGLLFVLAGVFAISFENTVSMFNAVMKFISSKTL